MHGKQDNEQFVYPLPARGERSTLRNMLGGCSLVCNNYPFVSKARVFPVDLVTRGIVLEKRRCSLLGVGPFAAGFLVFATCAYSAKFGLMTQRNIKPAQMKGLRKGMGLAR